MGIFFVGEDGPELILPKEDGQIVRLHDLDDVAREFEVDLDEDDDQP
jgi:hypothetical protein